MHNSDDVPTITAKIVALERAALDRWGKGDPDGYLEINAQDVTYFDPFLELRLDGLVALTAWYDQIRGKIKIDRDEIINPRVQVIGNAAILTMQYVSHGRPLPLCSTFYAFTRFVMATAAYRVWSLHCFCNRTVSK